MLKITKDFIGGGLMSTIGIVIPAYNAAQYLSTTIESVLAQTWTDWLCSIVDDGSTDDTGCIGDEYAARDPRIRVVRQANRGLAAARNRGCIELPACVTEMAFLDADDTWEPRALAVLHESLAQHPSYYAAHGLARRIDAHGVPLPRGRLEQGTHNRWQVSGGVAHRLNDTDPTTYAALMHHNVITVGTILVRRASLPSPRPFDETLRKIEDWDLWLRMTRHSSFAFVPDIILNYRWHADNMSLDVEDMWNYIIRVAEKAWNDESATAEQRALAGAFLERFWRTLAHNRIVWACAAAKRGNGWRAAMDVRHAIKAYRQSLPFAQR